MSKSYDKSFYIVATLNGEHYYQEGSYTEQEINRWINEFDIDEFLADECTSEEFSGPAEGHYAIYRQASVTTQEALDIGYAVKSNVKEDGSYTVTYGGREIAPEIQALYDKRGDELQAELDAEFGVDNDPLVCLKSFSTVVA